MRLGDLVRITDLSEEDLRQEGRTMGVVLGFDVYNPPREMRESRYLSSGIPRGERIARVLWSGTQKPGWILLQRLEVIGMQTEH